MVQSAVTRTDCKCPHANPTGPVGRRFPEGVRSTLKHTSGLFGCGGSQASDRPSEAPSHPQEWMGRRT